MLTHSASLTSSVIDVVDVVCVSSVKIFSSLTMSFSLSFSQITKENSLERGAISLRQLSFLLFFGVILYTLNTRCYLHSETNWPAVVQCQSSQTPRGRLTPGPLQATLSKLLYARANSASYPQWDGKWVATGWRPSVTDWDDGVSASCIVGPIVR